MLSYQYVIETKIPMEIVQLVIEERNSTQLWLYNLACFHLQLLTNEQIVSFSTKNGEIVFYIYGQ